VTLLQIPNGDLLLMTNQPKRKQCIKKFVDDNLIEILENLRPDLIFEYFSQYKAHWNTNDTWNIKISNDKLLGEYQNGELISGRWYNDKIQQGNISNLHKKLKLQAEKQKLSFRLFLNKLLCKGKQNGGISWSEYDGISFIEKHGEIIA